MFPRLVYLLLITALTAGSVSQVSAQKKKVSAAKPKVKATSLSTQGAITAASNPAVKLLSAKEKETLDEINFARANPGAYLKFLQEFRKNFRGKQIHFPGGRILVTNEGVDALDDAIKFLRDVKPAPPLEAREGMIKAARVHATDLISNNRSGHQGADGSKPPDRMSRFGTWNDTVGENIVYDSRDSRNDVILMMIDDGTSNRGHRKNLFKNDFKVIGIAIGQRPKAETINVITFAGGFNEHGSSNKANAPQKY